MRQGVNDVTTLVEQKKARLVCIANDVDPVEVSVVVTRGGIISNIGRIQNFWIFLS